MTYMAEHQPELVFLTVFVTGYAAATRISPKAGQSVLIVMLAAANAQVWALIAGHLAQ